MDTDFYLNKIEMMEKKGISFVDITKDFIVKIKDILPAASKFSFEPDNPITNKREFTDELFKYAERKGKDLTILHEGMEPIVLLNNSKYICMLEAPKVLNFPFSIFIPRMTFGYTWVYFYEYEASGESDKSINP